MPAGLNSSWRAVLRASARDCRSGGVADPQAVMARLQEADPAFDAEFATGALTLVARLAGASGSEAEFEFNLDCAVAGIETVLVERKLRGPRSRAAFRSR